jgi:hypothetical protein
MMQIGTGLPNQVRNMRPDVIPAWAAQAEGAGFSRLSAGGRYAYPGVSDTVTLAAAAAATSRIGLMSGVMLARQAAAHGSTATSRPFMRPGRASRSGADRIPPYRRARDKSPCCSADSRQPP